MIKKIQTAIFNFSIYILSFFLIKVSAECAINMALPNPFYIRETTNAIMPFLILVILIQRGESSENQFVMALSAFFFTKVIQILGLDHVIVLNHTITGWVIVLTGIYSCWDFSFEEDNKIIF